MEHSKSLQFAILASVCLAVQLPTAHAAIVISGDVDPADPASWNSDTDGYVGNTGDGELAVNAGSDLASDSGYIGYKDTATGIVTVTGAGSTWTANGLTIGRSGNGTLNIIGGAAVSSSSGDIGSYSGVTGVVTVDGAGSTWTNSRYLNVGRYGNGTLNISGGAEVSVAGHTNVAEERDFTGLIRFGTGGGTLTTGSLSALPTELTGTGRVNTRGLVSDVDLVFDSIASLTQNLVFDSQPGQNVTIHFDMANDPSSNGYLGAGWKGRGSLAIRDGVTVNSYIGYIGCHRGSMGTATVDGAGTTWVNGRYLHVGHVGSGTLNITGGATVSSAVGFVGHYSSSTATGVVTVDGAGSTWTNSDKLYVGRYGSGTLHISGGGAVSCQRAAIGDNDHSTGLVTVDGAGSTWTIGSNLGVGNTANGTLRITGGAVVRDGHGYIGGISTSTGVVTVDGIGSTWINNGNLYIGSSGSGTLDITGGAEVVTTAQTLVADGDVATGVIHFGTGGGTLTTGSLSFASPTELTGTGTINTRGLVADLDLVLDSRSLIQDLVFDSRPGQNVTVHFDIASDPSSNGDLGAGWKGRGSLAIRDGVTVNSRFGYVGYHSGSTGVVTVDGAASTWTNSHLLYVGREGSGTLSITGGAAVSSSECRIGYRRNATGVATVDGAGSTWTNGERLYVAHFGSGTLNITGGAIVNSRDTDIGCRSGSTGAVTVDGAGSAWTHDDNLYVGREGSGTLHISGGGDVSAAAVSTNRQSLLAIDVGNGSLLEIDGGSGEIDNDGEVRILAGAGAMAGSVHEPISATTWDGSGAYQAVGGTWDETSHQFTVSDVEPGTSGSIVTIDRSLTQRILIDDAQTGWSVGASFLAADSNSQLNLTATAVGGPALAQLQALLDAGDAVLGAWTFEVTDGYSAGDPAYLSFDLGSGFDRSDLNLWHHDGSQWTEYVAADLSCNGDYASFTVTGISGYAVSVVPEPGSLALLAAAALALLALARWKPKKSVPAGGPRQNVRPPSRATRHSQSTATSSAGKNDSMY